jgi:biopolymer transport protein ExbD
MARANLQQLLGNIEDPPSVPASKEIARKPVDESVVEVSVKADGPVAVRSPRRPERATKTEQQESADALFSALQRKETRIREDQQNALTMHARRLSKSKGAGGRRITDNTLVRVAIDLLLAHSNELAGATEDELRRSVGL